MSLRVSVTRTAHASSQGDLDEGTGREELVTGFTITSIELETEGEVPGVDADTFARLARQAKDTCPVSRALAGTDITLEARLVGD